MKLKTVNEIRKLITIFCICILLSCLIDEIFTYPFWIDIILICSISIPINTFVLNRLDVEEI